MLSAAAPPPAAEAEADEASALSSPAGAAGTAPPEEEETENAIFELMVSLPALRRQGARGQIGQVGPKSAYG